MSFFIGLGTLGGDKDTGFGPFGLPGSYENALILFQSIISRVIGVLTIAGGIWFIFQFIVGAYGWMNSGGDKAALKTAQDRITHAVSGLVILVAAYALISIIGSLLGLSILNPYEVLVNIK